MFRLTRSFGRLQRPNLMRFSSSARTDEDLTSDDPAADLAKKKRDAERPDAQKPNVQKPEVQKSVTEFGAAREEFFGEIARQAKNKQELSEFREDLNKLTLAECLQKYECSFADALKLDPALQKRILIKVRMAAAP